MRFSLWLGLTNPWADVLDGARHAEATGWDGLYVADHFMPDAAMPTPIETPTFEATAALSALAAATERVRLGALVLGITYRHPAVLAKWAVTTDHVSGGRLLLGLGAGWQENEHEQYGIALGPPRERLARFDEAVLIIRGLLDEPRTTLAGAHYTVTDAVAEPKPMGPMPLLIGGKGDRMLGLVARHADEWNMWATPALIARRRAALDERCGAIGRDPGTIATSTQALVFVLASDDDAPALVERMAPRPVLAGTPAALVDQVGAYRDAGVDELIVPDFTLGVGNRRADALDALAEGVFPHLR